MLASDPFLLRALALARSAVSRGNHPFGAVLVFDGRIIAAAENTVNSDRDVTAHAEMNLIREAWRSLPTSVLEACTLYSSTEPCAMCSGAIYWAGVGAVVFGCSNSALSSIVGGTLQIRCEDILKSGIRKARVAGPARERKFRRIHELYWLPGGTGQ